MSGRKRRSSIGARQQRTRAADDCEPRCGELGRRGRAVNGARILLLGIAYKKDEEDTRESPALYILNELEAMGASCDYHDP